MRGEASALVVSADEVNVHRVLYLKRQKIQQHLARKLSAIDIVSQEEIAAVNPGDGVFEMKVI